MKGLQGQKSVRRKSLLVQTLMVLGILVLLGVFFALTREIERVVRAEIEQKYNDNQLELARTIGDNLRRRLNQLKDDLLLISSFLDVRDWNRAGVRRRLDDFLAHHTTFGLRKILVLDPHGRVTYSTDPSLQGRRLAGLAGESKRQVSLSRVQQRGESPVGTGLRRFFVLSAPAFGRKPRPVRSAGKPSPSGYVLFVVDFDSLAAQFLQAGPQMEGERIWVMDAGGRLLYHSNHPEMEFRSIWADDPSCKQCHSSFRVQDAVIRGQLGTGKLHVGTDPVQLIAYYPIAFSGQIWTIVISTPLDVIEHAVLAQLRKIRILLGVTLFGILIAGGVLLFLHHRHDILVERSRYMRRRLVLEQQLCQKNRLSTIGEMVASVAHEINTPLSVVSSRAEYALTQLKEAENIDEVAEDLQTIVHQADRIAHITQSLLQFSRNQPFEPRPVRLQDSLRWVQDLISLSVREKKIQLILDVPEDLPLLLADPYQLEEVFLNLLNNAIGAIGEQGEIRITARVVEDPDMGSCVEVAVRDTGEGIPRDVLKHIFDPFFTTKGAGQGTGLGLTVVRRVVRKHGGKIRIESQPRQGTTVFVYLPLAGEGEKTR